MVNYNIFSTTKGYIGLAFTETGLCRLVLPSTDQEQVRRELLAGAGEDWVEVSESKYISELQRYFAGEPVNLNLPVDWSWATPFQKQVLQLVKQIPYGKTETYGSVAEQLGKPQAARAVGNALSRNRVPLVVPCHRVLASGGRSLGGFTSRNGLADKVYLLELEGVKVR